MTMENDFPRHELGVAQVIKHIPDKHAVQVLFRSGQALGTPVYVLCPGAADGYRIFQTELPTLGSWGIVLIPDGDDRNAVWIGSINAWELDAINNNPNSPDPYMHYLAHYSGFYKLLDQNGNQFVRFPDGTSLQIGSTTTPPTIYRHSMGGSNGEQRVAVPYPDSERVKNPPSPFNVQFSHPSKTSVLIDPSGNLTATLGTGSTGTLQTQNGTYFLKLDQNGNLTINALTATVETPAGNSVNLDTTGDVKVTAAANVDIDATSDVNVVAALINLLAPIVLGTSSGGQASSKGPITLTVPSGDTVSIGSGSAFLQLVTSAFVTIFNNHIHNGINGPTSAPTTSMGSAQLTQNLLGS